MNKEQVQELIEDMLEYYYPEKFRFKYSRKQQEAMVHFNKGLITAMERVLHFANAEDKENLVQWTRDKIAKRNEEDEEEENEY